MFFTVTFVCFTVPFLIEIILNVCAFPNEASEEMRSVYQAYDKRNNVDGTGGIFWVCVYIIYIRDCTQFSFLVVRYLIIYTLWSFSIVLLANIISILKNGILGNYDRF
mgnify:CR=1 FL=1